MRFLEYFRGIRRNNFKNVELIFKEENVSQIENKDECNGL